MLVSSGMHVILLTVHSIVLGLGYNPHDKKLDNAFPNPQDDREMLITGFTENNSHGWKRGVSLTAQGAIALRRLLSETKPAYSKGERYRNYHRQGDYVTALQDFFSVDPRKVKIKKTKDEKTVIRGLVGDRQLVLHEDAPMVGGPMLDIVDLTAKYRSRGWGTKSIDRIMYRKKLYNTGQF